MFYPRLLDVGQSRFLSQTTQVEGRGPSFEIERNINCWFKVRYTRLPVLSKSVPPDNLTDFLKVSSSAACAYLINHGCRDYFTWQDIEQPDPDQSDISCHQLSRIFIRENIKYVNYSRNKSQPIASSHQRQICKVQHFFQNKIYTSDTRYSPCFTFLAANYTSLPDLQNGNIYNIYNIYTMKAGHFSANKKCFGYLDWIHQTDLILDKMKHISPDLPYLADHTIVEEGDSESYNRFNCFHSANERAGQ